MLGMQARGLEVRGGGHERLSPWARSENTAWLCLCEPDLLLWFDSSCSPSLISVAKSGAEFCALLCTSECVFLDRQIRHGQLGLVWCALGLTGLSRDSNKDAHPHLHTHSQSSSLHCQIWIMILSLLSFFFHVSFLLAVFGLWMMTYF